VSTQSGACTRPGVKIAVATSGTRRWIDYVIDRLGLGAETATISGEDVREPKPHPEAYRRATAALGVAARRCAVVEDSERGYRAAIEAGCIVVVLNRHGHEPHRFTDAVAVTTSMPHARDVLLKAATGGVD
jgi:beta-phosphoglucomutase-like phosphatase (HAD superfamily)